MAVNRFHSLGDVNPGSYNWNVKVRIVRSWRGVSFSGEEFKGLNLLLLDDKNIRMHAFVPGNIIENHEDKFSEGNICKISNFSVKQYKPDEKFRSINSDKQIILTTYSKVEKIYPDDMLIPKNMFDFYDLCDLSDITNDNLYLTDVIGVIQRDLPLAKVMNRFNNIQSQVKFTIVDGRASVNVTFWDSIADEFVKAISNETGFPIIIIIASAKVTSWQGSKHSTSQVELSNVSATKFYLNYEDHTVWHLRQLLDTPLFSQYDFSAQIPEKVEVLSVDEIKKL
ncbi:hypothetical protein POM88_022995 [Heracleum sosnowskyi]|uniref:Replication protein A OB domain-containing protein n=1 Tax=Heracleum sosnowskyi TaxID=360622 RepID=A0AAD8MQ39_9APIA|nr:hypothetical protein POM88_022995 [Heracleum sosnowskyi]